MSWLGRWPPARQPQSRSRFVESALDVVRAAGLELHDAESLLDAPYGRALIANTQLTPAQVVVAAVVDVRGLAPLFRRHAKRRWVLVTPELAARAQP